MTRLGDVLRALAGKADGQDGRIADLEARLAAAEYDTGWENIYYVEGAIEIKARRVGKQVTLVGHCWGKDILHSREWAEIATLPERFRPAVEIPFSVLCMGGFDYEPCGSSRIEVNGCVSLFLTQTPNYWKFSVNYPAA